MNRHVYTNDGNRVSLHTLPHGLGIRPTITDSRLIWSSRIRLQTDFWLPPIHGRIGPVVFGSLSVVDGAGRVTQYTLPLPGGPLQ